jgi:hypothetical protein
MFCYLDLSVGSNENVHVHNSRLQRQIILTILRVRQPNTTLLQRVTRQSPILQQFITRSSSIDQRYVDCREWHSRLSEASSETQQLTSNCDEPMVYTYQAYIFTYGYTNHARSPARANLSPPPPRRSAPISARYPARSMYDVVFSSSRLQTQDGCV